MKLSFPLIKYLKKNWEIFLAGILFALLLFRNPYSTRTLIPNLEPYPDSIHYISPAENFLKDRGFYISRLKGRILPNVPPFYSVLLIPFYVVNRDVRTFYFVNVFLSFFSFFIFFKTILLLFPKLRFVRLLLLLLYITSYTVYWYPELAMAENLIMPLFLLAVYLLLESPRRINFLILGFLSVSFYATKFASLPLSVGITVLSVFRLCLLRNQKKFRHYITVFLISFLFSAIGYLLYEKIVRSNNLIAGLWGLFTSVFVKSHTSTQANTSSFAFFSTQYIENNIRTYLSWFIGKPIYVLWKQVVIIPKIFAYLGCVGLILGLFKQKYRWGSIVIGLLVALTILFMMTFYAADGRYFITAIPSLIIGVGISFSFFMDFIPSKQRFFEFLLTIGFLIYLIFSVGKQVKYDILLNLRHEETPWYYVSIVRLDTYLSTHKKEFTKEPVVISSMPPYLFDFYAHSKMILLPLSSGQEFMTYKYQVWGNVDYDNLTSEYAQYLQQGNPVFLASYGLGNEMYLHNAFNLVLNTFITKDIDSGCFNLCNIYQLIALKTPKSQKSVVQTLKK